MIRPPSDDLVNRLKALVGPEGWTDDPDILAPRLVEWRDRWSGRTPLMLSPASTEETAAVVGLCAAADRGMARYQALLAGAQEQLEPGGVLVLELDAQRAAETAQRAVRYGFVDVHVVQDYSGRDRVLTARAPAA